MNIYEQKYKEALERAKGMWEQGMMPERIEHIFPELKESEDERIRKELITHCRNIRCVTEEGAETIAKWIAWLEKQDSYYTFEIKKGHWYKCICDYMLNSSDLMFKNDRLYYCRSDWRLAGEIDERNVKDIGVNGYKSFFRPATNQEIKDWLEKQGEKKPADKVEPKFHKGDWIIHQGTENIYQVVAVIDNQYQLKYGDNYTVQNCADVDRCARLWDIAKDAKDGDVLAVERDKTPFIFKGFDRFHPECPVAYCGIDDSGIFVNSDDGWWTDEKVYPATKEQREQLEKAMADARYEWDSEKKELKNIKQKPFDYENANIQQKDFAPKVEPKFKVGDKVYALGNRFECTIESIDETTYYGDTTNFDIKDQDDWELVEQKPSWSEEDERTIKRIDSLLYAINESNFEDIHAWLESLKNKVQPKQEWSEQEQVRINRIVSCLENLNVADNDILLKDVDWLKSLKERVGE